MSVSYCKRIVSCPYLDPNGRWDILDVCTTGRTRGLSLCCTLQWPCMTHYQTPSRIPDAGPGWSHEDIFHNACVLSFVQTLFLSVLGSHQGGRTVWPHKSTKKAANRQVIMILHLRMFRSWSFHCHHLHVPNVSQGLLWKGGWSKVIRRLECGQSFITLARMYDD